MIDIDVWTAHLRERLNSFGLLSEAAGYDATVDVLIQDVLRKVRNEALRSVGRQVPLPRNHPVATADEVATLYEVHRTTVQRVARKKKIGSTLGRRTVYDVADIRKVAKELRLDDVYELEQVSAWCEALSEKEL